MPVVPKPVPVQESPCPFCEDHAPAERVDLATAAGIVGTSIKFIRRRIADGTLPAYRIRGSKLLRVDTADVLALMQPVAGGDD